MNVKKMLVNDNPKALQFLHDAHGFDFEKPIYVGEIPGRFTYKTVKDAISANIEGDPFSVILVKPGGPYRYDHLYYAAVGHGKFNIDVNRSMVSTYKFSIYTFSTIKYFEEVRKTAERVYIIAQQPEYLVAKHDKPLMPDERYKVVDRIGRCSDRCGNIYINEIKLRRADGSREAITYKPWSSFYPGEKRSNVPEDYVDKSGYILRMRRMELRKRVTEYKARRNAEELARTDFSERKKKIDSGIAAVKKLLAESIMAASSYDDVTPIYHKISNFRWLLRDVESIDKGSFSDVAAKNRFLDKIEEDIEDILC